MPKAFSLLIAVLLCCCNMLQAQTDTIKTYHKNGKAASIVPMYEGLREGEARYFDENGSPTKTVTFESGIVSGPVRIYWSNGNIREFFAIENGRRTGPTDDFSKEGVYTGSRMFEDGKLVIEEPEEEIQTQEDKTPKKIIIEDYLAVKPPRGMMKKEAYNIPEIELKRITDEPEINLTESDTMITGDEPPADILPEPLYGWDSVYSKLVYPEFALKRKITGTVKIKLWIDERGRVEKTEIIEGIGYGLADVAEIVLRYTDFEPAIKNGRAVPIEVVVPIEWKLPETEQGE